jgi:hypothetical protein
VLAPTATIAAALAIPAGTIRRYAHHGWITRHGTSRRALYDPHEVARARVEHDTPSTTRRSA